MSAVIDLFAFVALIVWLSKLSPGNSACVLDFSWLGIPFLMYLSLLCLAPRKPPPPNLCQAITTDLVGGRFSVLLRRFHLGTLKTMQRALKESGAIISGSAALTIFQAGRFMPNDVDFYVLESGHRRLSSYLRECGYNVDEIYDMHYPFDRQMRTVEVLCREGSPSRLNVIVCEGPHLVSTISRFHSTLVMNYIASYGAVCLYPLWTMNNVGLVTRVDFSGRHPASASVSACIDKYRRRGFTLLYTVGDDRHGGSSTHTREAIRSLHDDDVLFIPFDPVSYDIRDFEGPVSWKVTQVTLIFICWYYLTLTLQLPEE